MFPKGVFIKHPLQLGRGVVTPSRVRRGTFTSLRGMTAAKSYGRNPAKGASQNDTPWFLRLVPIHFENAAKNTHIMSTLALLPPPLTMLIF